MDVVLRRADIVSVTEARIAIETEAPSLAPQRRTPAELREMRRTLAGREASRSVIEEHVDADTAFHRSIVIAAHNPVLAEPFGGFVPRSRQAMIEMLRIHGTFGSDADHDAHARLPDAIASRDGKTAAVLSRTHLHALTERLS